MYAEALTGTDIEFGKELWNALRGNRKFPADGALWLFQSQSGEWHLMIATPRVDEVGPRKAYEELANITRRGAADSPPLLTIELITPRFPFYQALRSLFGKPASLEEHDSATLK